MKSDMTVKNPVFPCVTPCSFVEIYQRLKETYSVIQEKWWQYRVIVRKISHENVSNSECGIVLW